MGKAEIIHWKIDRPGARKGTPDVWSISATDGAVAARRKGAPGVRKGSDELTGRRHLERFGPTADDSGRLWPPAFRFNPWTGEPLQPALDPLAPAGSRWGAMNGLPMVDADGQTIDTASKQTEALARGAFYFAQGGTPGFLYAADLFAGVVYRRSRLEDEWVDHGSYPHCLLPPWASGMVGNRDGAFYSGETAIVRLNEDPEDDGAEKYDLGPMVSSPAALPAGIAAPYAPPEGLMIGWLPIGGKISRLAVRGVNPQRAGRPLGAPAVTHADVVYWTGDDGFISFQIGRSGPQAAWRAWPAGFVAIPHLRPYRSANGQLWALGQYDDGEGGSRSAACMISATANSPDMRILEGPHVSAGDHTYRNLSRHSRPWADADGQVQTGLDMSDRWVLPVTKLPGGDTIVALVSDSASRRAFLLREETPTHARLATLFVHKPNAGLTAMGHSFDLATTDDLDVFVSADRVHIYHRDTNECVSWRLV